MIADDFKAINAAMKANEQPKNEVTIAEVMSQLAPCIAAVRFAEVASRDMQGYPARDYLGDPEC